MELLEPGRRHSWTAAALRINASSTPGHAAVNRQGVTQFAAKMDFTENPLPARHSATSAGTTDECPLNPALTEDKRCALPAIGADHCCKNLTLSQTAREIPFCHDFRAEFLFALRETGRTLPREKKLTAADRRGKLAQFILTPGLRSGPTEKNGSYGAGPGCGDYYKVPSPCASTYIALKGPRFHASAASVGRSVFADCLTLLVLVLSTAISATSHLVDFTCDRVEMPGRTDKQSGELQRCSLR